MRLKNNRKISYILFTIMILQAASVYAKIATGPLTVHPTNPRYFTDGSGKAIYLTGSHTWMNLQDFKVSGYPDFDWDEYLDFLQSNNHNFARLWVTEYEFDKDNDVWATPCPYQRPGPGTAYDGRAKYDLTKFNQAYLNRLRSRIISARDRGIYVSVMLFSSFGSDYDDTDQLEAWKSHPFHQGNNINGINADCNGDGKGTELHTMCDSNVLALQEDYVRKIVDSVNDLDNVLFEIGNEMAYESKDFQYHMIDLIKNHEAAKTNQHPVGMTTGGPTVSGGWTNMEPTVFLNSNADWISLSSTWGDVTDNPPETNGSKVVILDTDHIPRPEHRDWVWKSLCRGYNPVLMDVLQVPYPYAIGEDWNDPDNPIPRRLEIRQAMGHALSYAQKMDLAAMTPQSSLASTGYCLADPGSEYLVYQPDFGPFTVNLEAGTYDYEWFNPGSGSVAGTDSVTVSSGSRSFNPVFSGDAVLYLHAKSSFPPGMIGHWTFDEGSGTTAEDSSGNNNYGTIIGATWTNEGIKGALSFDGVNDYIRVSDSPSLDITNEMSVAAWVYRNADQIGWRVIATREKGTGNPEHYYLGFLNNEFRWFVNTDSYSNVDVGSAAPNSEWIHMVGTYDGADVRMYINGQLAFSEHHNGSFSIDDNPILIGAATNDHGTTYKEYFKGIIDEVQIYNKALSEEEILALYDQCIYDADIQPCDGCIDFDELFAYIDLWKQNQASIGELMEAIGLWKGGCG